MWNGEPPEQSDDHAEAQGQPDAVNADRDCAAHVARADAAGHRGGGRVGEKNHQANGSLQDRAGDGEPGQRGLAEVADHGGVGEKEERFGDEGAKRGDGEAQDLAVDGPPGQECSHSTSLGAAAGGGASPTKRGFDTAARCARRRLNQRWGGPLRMAAARPATELESSARP